MLTIPEYETIVAMSYKDMIDSRLRVDQDLFALIAIQLNQSNDAWLPGQESASVP